MGNLRSSELSLFNPEALNAIEDRTLTQILSEAADGYDILRTDVELLRLTVGDFSQVPALNPTNNLSDLENTTKALENLGLGSGDVLSTLGLGTMASQNASSVSITGGDLTGLSQVSIKASIGSAAVELRNISDNTVALVLENDGSSQPSIKTPNSLTLVWDSDDDAQSLDLSKVDANTSRMRFNNELIIHVEGSNMIDIDPSAGPEGEITFNADIVLEADKGIQFDDIGGQVIAGTSDGLLIASDVQLSDDRWISTPQTGLNPFGIQFLESSQDGVMLGVVGTLNEAIRCVWDGAIEIGFFGSSPIAQYSSTGSTVGFSQNVGTEVRDDSTFDGGYTIDDMAKALRQYGLLA